MGPGGLMKEGPFTEPHVDGWGSLRGSHGESWGLLVRRAEGQMRGYGAGKGLRLRG